MIQEIILLAQSQSLNVRLEGITYGIDVIWRGGYYLSISSSGKQIVTGIPLVTGCDLLAQYKYLKIPGKWIIYSDVDRSIVPEYSTLGQTSHLLVIT